MPELPTVRSSSAWKIALWLQCAITTVGWVSLCLLSGLPGARPSIELVFFGSLIWQCAMLGCWAGLGNARWRWLIIALASPLLGVVCSIAADGELLEFQVFCLGIIGVVSLTTLTLRRWKGRLHQVHQSVYRAEALQFGIKHVFTWTTAIAVFLGIGKYAANYLVPLGSSTNGLNTLLMIFGLAACVSLATVVNIWAMLGDRVSAIKIFSLVIVTAGAMLGNYLLAGRGFIFAGMVLASQALILITMLLLRMQRLRFVKSLES